MKLIVGNKYRLKNSAPGAWVEVLDVSDISFWGIDHTGYKCSYSCSRGSTWVPFEESKEVKDSSNALLQQQIDNLHQKMEIHNHYMREQVTKLAHRIAALEFKAPCCNDCRFGLKINSMCITCKDYDNFQPYEGRVGATTV